MKPILIGININNGMASLTKEELEKIIDDCYNQGLKDGSSVTITTTPPEPSPYTPYTPPAPIPNWPADPIITYSATVTNYNNYEGKGEKNETT